MPKPNWVTSTNPTVGPAVVNLTNATLVFVDEVVPGVWRLKAEVPGSGQHELDGDYTTALAAQKALRRLTQSFNTDTL